MTVTSLQLIAWPYHAGLRVDGDGGIAAAARRIAARIARHVAYRRLTRAER